MRFIIYPVILLMVLLVGYLLTFPHVFWRFTHPFASFFSSKVYTCSAGAPSWLYRGLIHAIDRHGATSAQIAYISPQGDLYNCEMGFTGRRFLEPVTSENQFRLASTTKIITYDAIAKLVEEEKIKWTDRLVDLLNLSGEFKDSRVRTISVADLSDHRSGFGRNLFSGTEMIGQRRPWCKDSLSEIKNVRLFDAPGENFRYSNINFCLLGLVIEQASGDSFEVFIEKKYRLASRKIIFADSNYSPSEVRYSFTFDADFNSNSRFYNNYNSLAAAAGLLSSAKDFAVLLEEVLSKKQVPTSDKPSYDCIKSKPCRMHGMYYLPADTKGVGVLYHEGFIDGAASIAVKDSKGGVVVMVKNARNIPKSIPFDSWPEWLQRELSLYYDSVEQ